MNKVVKTFLAIVAVVIPALLFFLISDVQTQELLGVVLAIIVFTIGSSYLIIEYLWQ